MKVEIFYDICMEHVSYISTIYSFHEHELSTYVNVKAKLCGPMWTLPTSHTILVVGSIMNCPIWLAIPKQ